MERWIDRLAQSNLSRQQTARENQPASIQMIAFYIALGLLGIEEQMACYSQYMADISDDGVRDKVIKVNQVNFKQQMLDHLYHYLILVGIYGEPRRLNYLE